MRCFGACFGLELVMRDELIGLLRRIVSDAKAA